MFRRVRAYLSIIALGLAAASCAAPRAAAIPPAPGAMARKAPRTDPCEPQGSTLAGVCKTTSFTLANGAWKVSPSEGFVVYATDEIYIFGDVSFKSGTLLALYAPKITITGQVFGANADGPRTANQPPKVTDVIDSCDFHDTDQEIEIPSGDDLAIVADKPSGCDLEFGGIALWPAAAGGQETKLRQGQDGGNILIGTPAARDAARRVASQANLGVNVKAFPPSTFGRKGSNIAAGSAGNGFNDCSGQFYRAGDTWLFSPGGGGKGGSVAMYVTHLIKGIGAFGGYGGTGGMWCQPQVDGIPTDVNAANIAIFQGSGGDGGDVTSNMGGVVRHGGTGGSPGFTSSASVSIAAGNGWSNPTAAGNAGRVQLFLGTAGKGGNGGGADGTYPAIFISGGLGASASASSATVNGGNGGALTIDGPKHASPDVPFPKSLIEVDGFNGGFGQGPCGGTGGNGGAGGTIRLNGIIGLDLLTIESQSFDGGDGASGASPGSGGAAGEADVNGTKQTIGDAGSAGGQC